MRKLIAAINMTVDGVCDHTAVNPDETVHQHYTDLLNSADTILYGRVTYQLMEDYWPALVEKPSGNKAMDDFAAAIDRIKKIVFSRTLKSVDWKNTELKHELVKEDIAKLKQQAGGDILVGSPGMIIALLKLGLIDECQLCIHPVVAGSGRLLFKNVQERIGLRLLNTKTFDCGAIILYYAPQKE